MPQAAGVWVAQTITGVMAAAGAGASTLVAATYAAYAIGYGATVLALSAGLSKISASLTGKPRLGAGMQSRKVVIRSSTEYRTILYGTGRTGGVLVYANTCGDKNEFLDFVIAIAGHQIDAITDVWFDDVKIAEADIASGAAAGGAVGGSGQYRARGGVTVAYVYKYLGTDTQTASPILTADYPTEWTSDHRGRGVAYVHIRLRRNSEAFEQGAPGNFTFGYRGALVYDPRLDTTQSGGSGSHRVATPSTWAYSNNWALCVADYLIGGSVANTTVRVNRRGFGANPNDVKWSTVMSAANICDENVSIPGSTTQKRYTCDGALSQGEIPAENLERLLTAGLGQLTYSSDGYRLYAGAYNTPTLTLGVDDLAGEVSCVADTTRGDRYNAVKGSRWDTTTGQEVEFLPRSSATYQTTDGAYLPRDIELPFTTDEYRAQRIAQIILRRSREQEILTFHGNPGCLRIGVWETVTVTIADLNISSKVYRCIAREEHEDESVTLTLREELSSTYTDPDVADYGALNPADPDPAPSGGMDEPTGFMITAVPDGLQFAWTLPQDRVGGDVIELWEYSSATPFSSATKVWEGTASSVFLAKFDTTTRYYWIRAKRLNGFVSDTVPATSGAPSGAASAGTALNATISTSSISKSDSGSSITTASVTVTPSGGTAPYTYSWTKVTGDTITADSSTAATTTFSATSMASGATRVATFRCTVTDNVAATVTRDVVVTITRSSMSVSLSPSSLFKDGTGSALTTDSTTATASGGTPSYTYAWTKVSGGNITIGSASSATTTFSASALAVGESRTATFRCTATDSTGGTPLTAYADIVVTIDRTYTGEEP